MLGVVAMAALLGGCESSSLGLGSFGLGQSETPKPVSLTTAPETRLALAPIIGAPANVSKTLAGELTAAMAQKNIKLAANDKAAEYVLRGYLAASPDKGGTKLAYIWDVTGKDGKRAYRIRGEELVKGKTGGDPWAHVSQAVVKSVALKTADKLAQWAPKMIAATQTKAPATTQPKLAANKAPTVTAPKTTASIQKKPVRMAALPTTGGKITAVVMPVTGAPGDGKTSLTKAIKKQLYARGIKLVGKKIPGAYTVRGRVELGKPQNGRQRIAIRWDVYDPAGKRVGTVSQKNTIPQGALDGKWGPVADQAAGAAAQGIVKLMPRIKK